MRSIQACIVALLLLLASPMAGAQQKPIRVLVGLSPGGAVEMVSRLYADKLRVALGQPVIVENRVGASGLIAMDALRASPADGSVLLFAPNGGVTLLPHTFRNPRFDPFKDVAPVAMVARLDVVLGVHPAVNAKTLAEFVALAKADQRYRSFGAAPGTIPHLLAALFAEAAGFEALHVPYKGAGQVAIDLIGGQLPASLITTGEGLPHSRAGKLRLLAMTGAERSPLMPEVPTMRELGYPVQANAWFGFYAPGATPPAVIDRLGRALVEASQTPEVRERLTQVGIEPDGRSSGETLKAMRADYEMWGKAVRIAGIQPQD
jgi:tripartite-type tricarboxylate transporter receptor subunit TctC